MSDLPGEWVDKTSYVMPTIPEELRVDPILASLLHEAVFLELSGDDVVDPDNAVEAMEHVGAYLQRLDAATVRRIQSDLDRIADHGRKSAWPDDLIEFIQEFLRNSGIGDEEN